MKFVTIYLIAFILTLLSIQQSQGFELPLDLPPESAPDRSLFEYYGSDHAEAQFTISGYVLLEQKSAPTKMQVDPQIRAQLRYMLGLMRSRANDAAALYPKWTSTIKNVKALSPGVYQVFYELKTKGVFPKGKTQYTFTLPTNPKKIFSKAQGKCNEDSSEESNFWYHWEPLRAGCPLKENADYFTVNVPLKAIENTIKSYPEYDKLADASKLIKVTMFFGFENYGHQNWSPNGGEDWGIKGFNQQRAFLTQLGFTETVWTPAQTAVLYKGKDRFVPYIAEFNYTGKVARIRIRLMLSDSGFNYNSTAFHLLLREALAKESVIVYNGHSGIGHNLDLTAIEKLRNIKFVFNPKYQILFLGSCVPYSYYTDMFFSRKKTSTDPLGSLNLDIMSYGKESVFGNVEDQALTKALTSYAASGEKLSYQVIINSSPNYFFGVNGDEDNPKK